MDCKTWDDLYVKTTGYMKMSYPIPFLCVPKNKKKRLKRCQSERFFFQFFWTKYTCLTIFRSFKNKR